MKTGVTAFLLFLLFSATAERIGAQTTSQTPRPSVNRLENLRPLDDRDDLDFSRRTSIENLPAEYRVSSKAEKRTKFTDQEKEQYKEIKKGGVSLLKMFVAPACADKLVVDVGDPRCAAEYDYLPISYYSFFDGTHGQFYGEFRLSEDSLIAGRGAGVQGISVDLGERPISEVDKKSPEVMALAAFTVAKTVNQAKELRKDLDAGIETASTRYSTKQKLVVGHTYLLRLVAYALPESTISQYNYDSIILLRIESVSADRMAVISWKKISERTAPRLKDDK